MEREFLCFRMPVLLQPTLAEYHDLQSFIMNNMHRARPICERAKYKYMIMDGQPEVETSEKVDEVNTAASQQSKVISNKAVQLKQKTAPVLKQTKKTAIATVNFETSHTSSSVTLNPNFSRHSIALVKEDLDYLLPKLPSFRTIFDMFHTKFSSHNMVNMATIFNVPNNTDQDYHVDYHFKNEEEQMLYAPGEMTFLDPRQSYGCIFCFGDEFHLPYVDQSGAWSDASKKPPTVLDKNGTPIMTFRIGIPGNARGTLFIFRATFLYAGGGQYQTFCNERIFFNLVPKVSYFAEHNLQLVGNHCKDCQTPMVSTFGHNPSMFSSKVDSLQPLFCSDSYIPMTGFSDDAVPTSSVSSSKSRRHKNNGKVVYRIIDPGVDEAFFHDTKGDSEK